MKRTMSFHSDRFSLFGHHGQHFRSRSWSHHLRTGSAGHFSTIPLTRTFRSIAAGILQPRHTTTTVSATCRTPAAGHPRTTAPTAAIHPGRLTRGIHCHFSLRRKRQPPVLHHNHLRKTDPGQKQNHAGTNSHKNFLLIHI